MIENSLVVGLVSSLFAFSPAFSKNFLLTDRELENRFGAVVGGFGEMDRVGFAGDVEGVELVGRGRDKEADASSSGVGFDAVEDDEGSAVVD